MFEIMEPEEAVKLIKDGAVIGLNSFVGLANPEKLHDAITESFRKTGHPRNLTLVSSAGFGLFDPDRAAEPYIREGAVSKIICGHYGAMPSTKRIVLEDRFEAYNLPLGPMTHAMRAQAGGHRGYLTRIGIGLFVDPRIEGPGLNNLSHDESLVRLMQFDGRDYLLYSMPDFDIALIKASSVDAYGNISFENEYCTIDALSIAQLTKRHNGKVIVQVDSVRHDFSRPRDVIIPAFMVDAVVVCEPEGGNSEASGTLSGEIHVPPTHMQYWFKRLDKASTKKGRSDDSADIIGRRATKELKRGDVVNIGFGIPEMVSKYAAEEGILQDLTLSVESGGTGGLPASGSAFGAMIGAGTIVDMSMQFDFYDGGGLDVCFMGGLEMDSHGNVNSHRGADQVSGIGGFGNITSATHNVIFCLTTSAKGLDVRQQPDGSIKINKEGGIKKIVKDVRSISFSGKMAIERGQRVLYVTERCVFELKPEGLAIVEVYPGVDIQRDIIDRLDFPVINAVK